MRVNSIQFLRAVAALLVAYEHSMDVVNRYSTSWQQKFYQLDNFGCIGVDLFFVISGFIITYVANKYIGFDDGINFLQKRFNRINPVYYIATLLCLVVFLIQQNVNHVPSKLYINNLFGSLIDSLIILPTSGDNDGLSPVLIIGWTLSFEWLFYLIFFALIICKIKRKALFLTLSILVLIGIGQLVKPNDLRIQFLTNPIMLEFILGVFICHFYLHYSKIPTWLSSILLLTGLLGYFCLIRFGFGDVWFYLDTITGKLSLNKFLLWGIPSGFIVAGCVFLEKNGHLKNLFSNRLTVLLGNASYSIYLIHHTVLVLLFMLYQKVGFFFPPDLMIWLQLILVVLISLGFYKAIEKPFLKYVQKNALKTKSTSREPISSYTDTKEVEHIEPIVN
jgi:exopolysaccharide production protein ExoZ